MDWIVFVIGVLVGAVAGLFIAGLLAGSRRGDHMRGNR